MGKRQPVDLVQTRRQRLGSLAVAGALPLVAALAAAGTSAAEPVSSDDTQPAVVDNQPAAAGPGGTDAQPGVVVDTPFGKIAVPVPQALADGAHNYLAATAAEVEGTAAEGTAAEALDNAGALDNAEALAPAPPAAPVRVGRNSATGVRDIPNAPLAPVDQGKLHQPNPMSAPDVAPIAAPEGKLRFGDTQVDIPAWLTPEQAAQVNALAAGAEAEVARTYDSAGFEPSRSDRMAAQTVGTAAVGAAVGVGVAAPLEIAGGVMGGFIGAMAGTPFAPAGWVFGPAVGASAAVTLIAIPAATVGAVIGGTVGAVNGYLAPATPGAPVDAAVSDQATAVADQSAIEES
ncbi:hypothetical protein [Nocardia seriolae]|uniref:Uncharacterized protein n=1 Tax=Nocardia seriolae TaxID=37332 RepID=A0ABC9YNH6_9NOCA|nr:hypothetical protein [Nocardia seriolae]BEK96340.1 hypothetical protein NSER024013_42460 [Nocardia seriolae]GAM44708.1 hypothetical protein NS07_v2contig00006-0098 [Nocardia seriolae]GAP26636.1 hypothetical protein NSK11_contig00008-0007 [Nocardia seriolae]